MQQIFQNVHLNSLFIWPCMVQSAMYYCQVIESFLSILKLHGQVLNCIKFSSCVSVRMSRDHLLGYCSRVIKGSDFNEPSVYSEMDVMI